MHEDVTTKLTQFTPTLPDRDALLFAAGRASARPAPVWKVLCGLLAVSPFTMGAFWLTQTTPTVNTVPVPADITGEDSYPPLAPDPYSYLALSKSADLDVPRSPVGPVGTERTSPPLKAGWRGELPQ